MKNDLKIAVCIPTFNRAQYLPEAIGSLLSQKESQFDVHVFDNASTDNSKALIESLYKDRVTWHEGEFNIGYVGNVNRCLALAQEYDWIGILHSDDKHVGESVEAVSSYAAFHPNVGLIFSDYVTVKGESKKGEGCFRKGKLFMAGDQAVMRCQRQIPCSATFYSSKAILDVGLYSEAYPYSADEEYSARVARHYDILQTNETIAWYRRHSGHTMITSWGEPDFIKSFEDMRILMNSYLTPLYRKSEKMIREEVAVTLLNQCSGLVAHGHLRLANKFYTNAFSKAPFRLLEPKRLSRLLLHYTPLLGPFLCRKLSKNAGLESKPIGGECQSPSE